jgi:uncharacterized protein
VSYTDVVSHTDIAKYVYDRFGQGDAASILELFDPNIEFRLAEGHPYQPGREPWIGKDAVAQNFFMKAAGEWDGWTMIPRAFLEMDDAVVVEGRYAGTYKPTGKLLDVQVCHVWRFSRGKITSFHQYLDSARLQQTMRAA